MRLLRGIYGWLDDRLGISSALLPIVAHPVPRSINWWYVLGSATLIAFVVQVITGVALAFSYVPAPNSAYETLEFITHQALFGNVVRGLHYWGSSAMVVLIFAHMVHVFLVGAYKYPREMTWIAGVLLFAMTMAMAFTGQLLRWNQDAYWAVAVVAAQVARVPLVGGFIAQVVIAGDTVGQATLTRFYATHVFLIPAAMFLLVGLHLYLVLRHGVSERAEPGRPVDPRTYKQEYERLLHTDGMPLWPDYAWKDVFFALVVGGIVLLLAIGLGAPELGQPADPTLIEAHPKPDWYFLWYFALLSYVPPALETVFMVGFPLLLGVLLLILPLVAPTGERSPWRRPWAVGIAGFSTLAILVLVWVGYQAPWSPTLHAQLPPAVTAGLQGGALRGAQLFQDEGCISCHVISGSGGQRGPELTTVGSRLTHEQLVWRILYGGNNMPAYGTTLQPDEVDALVEFLGAQRGQAARAAAR
jgi:ubiquinol-cytochrome c reductase cytochrome b subunit